MENPFAKRKHDSRDLVLKLCVRRAVGLLPRFKKEILGGPTCLGTPTRSENRILELPPVPKQPPPSGPEYPLVPSRDCLEN